MAGIDQYTKLMLHMNDNTFKDEISHTITNNGVTINTITKEFGNSSGYFNGSGNYLSTPHDSNFNFGQSGNFTIDFWINPTDYARTLSGIISTVYDSTVVSGFTIYFDTSGNLKANSTANGTAWEIGGTILLNTISVNTWTHIAVVKEGSNLYAFKNGIKGSSITFTQTATNTNNLLIGTLGTVNPWYFKGYIDELRISNIARWTSNFTPPIQEYIENKYLIKQNSNYYTIKTTNYDEVTSHNFIQLTLMGGSIPNSSDIYNFGFNDLNLLTNSMTKGSDIFIPISKFDNTAELKMYKG
jgi:hypothetical protein